MNKKIFSLIIVLASLAISGCNKNNKKSESTDSTHQYEIGERKNYKGTGAIFEEVLGYNTKDASIFQEGEVRYVIYDSNETEQGSQVFAARKATKDGDKWVYQEKHIVLRGVENGWDKNISNPSVIKGQFAYQGITYSYLMAYNGNNNSEGTNNHLGLAVSNDILGEWKRVGTTPILSNPEVYEASYGFGSPSLVSFDNRGKGYLFYAVGETQVSFEAVRTFDFSNLDNPQLEKGYASLPIKGLTDKVEGEAIIMNAGFAKYNDQLVMVRDRLPQSANRPNQTNEVEIAKAPISITSDISEQWTVIDSITGMDTMDLDDEESLGWDQIYSGELVTDEYGNLLVANNNFEVLYSTYDEESSLPSYSSTLAMHNITL